MYRHLNVVTLLVRGRMRAYVHASCACMHARVPVPRIWRVQEQGQRSVDSLQAAVQVQNAVIDNIRANGVGSADATRARRLQAQRSRVAAAAQLLDKYEPSRDGVPQGILATLNLYAQKVQGEVLEKEHQHGRSWCVTMVLDHFGADSAYGEGSGDSKKRARQSAAADLMTQLKLRHSSFGALPLLCCPFNFGCLWLQAPQERLGSLTESDSIPSRASCKVS